MTSFRVLGVDPAPFKHLYGLSTDELRAHGALRYEAEENSAHPDRIELRHAVPGERVLLVNYVHQPANTPYRASHAIFVLEGAAKAAQFVDAVPEPLRVRLLSLRAYDSSHMIVDAVVTEGAKADEQIRAMLDDPAVNYIQAHFAARGCYAARIERADLGW